MAGGTFGGAEAARLFVSVSAEVGDLKRKFDEAQRRIEQFERQAATSAARGATALESRYGRASGMVATSMRNAERAALRYARYGLAAVAGGALLVGVKSVQMAGRMEQAKIAFTTLLGSSRKAEVYLQRLKNFAASTPFEFVELQDATKRMLAYGFAAKDVLPMLENIGNATSALGTGSGGLNSIILALGQMRGMGKVMSGEMRQLATAGIPAWEMVAKAMGKSVREVMELSHKGALESSVGIAAIMKGMKERYEGLMRKQSHTLLGMWSNFKDRLSFILADVGDMVAEKFDLKRKLQGTIKYMGTEQFKQRVMSMVDAAAKFGSALQTVAVTLYRYRAGLKDAAVAGLVLYGTLKALLIAQSVTTALAGLSAASVGASGSAGMLRGSLGLVPFGPAGLAVMGVVGGLIALDRWQKRNASTIDNVNRKLSKEAEKYRELKKAMEENRPKPIKGPKIGPSVNVVDPLAGWSTHAQALSEAQIDKATAEIARLGGESKTAAAKIGELVRKRDQLAAKPFSYTRKGGIMGGPDAIRKEIVALDGAYKRGEVSQKEYLASYDRLSGALSKAEAKLAGYNKQIAAQEKYIGGVLRQKTQYESLIKGDAAAKINAVLAGIGKVAPSKEFLTKHRADLRQAMMSAGLSLLQSNAILRRMGQTSTSNAFLQTFKRDIETARRLAAAGVTVAVKYMATGPRGNYGSYYYYGKPGTKRATGGSVRGPGSSTSDSIDARLSDGEYVVRASSVRKYGESMLDAINKGSYPGYATGGKVSKHDRASKRWESLRGSLDLRERQLDVTLARAEGTTGLGDDRVARKALAGFYSSVIGRLRRFKSSSTYRRLDKYEKGDVLGYLANAYRQMAEYKRPLDEPDTGVAGDDRTRDLEAELARTQAQVSALTTMNTNLQALYGSGDIGRARGGTAIGSAANITINTLVPSDPRTLQAVADAANSGNSAGTIANQTYTGRAVLAT